MRRKQWSHISDSAKDLVRLLLDQNPNTRLTAEEALNHPWISERDTYAPKRHLNDTVDEIKKFNIRRRLKTVILGAVNSHKWQKPIINNITENETDEFLLNEQKHASLLAEDQASSIGMQISVDLKIILSNYSVKFRFFKPGLFEK